MLVEEKRSEKIEYLKKLENIKLNALPEVKKFMHEENIEARKPVNPSASLLAESLAFKISPNQSIFTKPFNATYFALLKKENKKNFEEMIQQKLWTVYNIKFLDPVDPTFTDEKEREEFQKQLKRFD